MPGVQRTHIFSALTSFLTMKVILLGRFSDVCKGLLTSPGFDCLEYSRESLCTPVGFLVISQTKALLPKLLHFSQILDKSLCSKTLQFHNRRGQPVRGKTKNFTNVLKMSSLVLILSRFNGLHCVKRFSFEKINGNAALCPDKGLASAARCTGLPTACIPVH